MQPYEAGMRAPYDPINTDLPVRMLLTHTAAIVDGPVLDDQYYNGKNSPVALRSFLAPNGQHYDGYAISIATHRTMATPIATRIMPSSACL